MELSSTITEEALCDEPLVSPTSRYIMYSTAQLTTYIAWCMSSGKTPLNLGFTNCSKFWVLTSRQSLNFSQPPFSHPSTKCEKRERERDHVLRRNSKVKLCAIFARIRSSITCMLEADGSPFIGLSSFSLQCHRQVHT